MYHVHTTDAYILERNPHGEANALITLFTREFGRIQAVAQGVRKGVSKLNPSLQEYSRVRVSLVRGREWWRVVSVGGCTSLFACTKNDEERLRVVVNSSKLLGRLVQGEEGNEALFDAFTEVMHLLADRSNTREVISALEIILVLRVLYHLGYVSKTDDIVSIIEEGVSDAIISKVLTVRSQLISSINTSLKVTQL